MYLFVKAAHIVGFVTWFAGLFYVVRLFIYDVEAADRPASEREILRSQFRLMERRLWYGITYPAMIATLTFGMWLVALYGFANPWVHIKLTLIALLVTYHLICGRIFAQLKNGNCQWTGRGLRGWNEVATFLLVAIVYVATFKSAFDHFYGAVGLGLFGIVLVAGVRYAAWRRRQSTSL